MKVKNEERKAKYMKVFSTTEGQWVLNDLTKRFTNHKGFGDGKGDGMTLALLLASERGEAIPIQFIERQIKGD